MTEIGKSGSMSAGGNDRGAFGRWNRAAPKSSISRIGAKTMEIAASDQY